MTVRPTGPRPFFPFGILRLSNQQKLPEPTSKKVQLWGVSLRHHRLRIWHCHSSGLDCCYSVGSIPGLEISTRLRQGQKKKRYNSDDVPSLFILKPHEEEAAWIPESPLGGELPRKST